MSNPLFCPNCGMLKSDCICGNSNNSKSQGPTNLFSFKRTISHSILDDEIPEVYSIDNHKLDEGTVAYLKEIYPPKSFPQILPSYCSKLLFFP